MVALAGLLLALAAVLLVLEPLLRPPVSRRPAPAPGSPDEQGGAAARRYRAVAALREIEFDRATGKLSDEDYAGLYQRYSAEAIEAMRSESAAAPDDPLEREIARARAARPAPAGAAGRSPRFCEQCGTALEGSGRFCVGCGSPSGVALPV